VGNRALRVQPIPLAAAPPRLRRHCTPRPRALRVLSAGPLNSKRETTTETQRHRGRRTAPLLSRKARNDPRRKRRPRRRGTARFARTRSYRPWRARAATAIAPLSLCLCVSVVRLFSREARDGPGKGHHQDTKTPSRKGGNAGGAASRTMAGGSGVWPLGRAPQHEVMSIVLTHRNLHPEEAAFAAVSKDPFPLPRSPARPSPKPPLRALCGLCALCGSPVFKSEARLNHRGHRDHRGKERRASRAIDSIDR
jgi:hypothetical protein